MPKNKIELLIDDDHKVVVDGLVAEIISRLLQDYVPEKKAPEKNGAAPSLTPREQEILELLSREYTNEKVAASLHISYRTVETHRKNMMHKTGAGNLAGLLRYAYDNGLLK